MKIELIKQVFDDNTSFKYKPFKWCCDKLENNPIINLVCEYTDENYNYGELEPVVTLRYSEIIYEYGEEWENNSYYKINVCPFCGEPIEISIVGEEDVSEIVSELKKERDKMWKKYNNTDSKKKSEELRKVVYDLDNKTNYFYDLFEYDENMVKAKKGGD